MVQPIADKLKEVGKGLSTYVTAPVVGLGAAALKTAADVEEMRGKFDAVFKDQATGVEAWANDHAKAIGRSRYDLMAYAAQLQDTFVPMGVARAEAAGLSKEVAQLAVDLASFNNQSEPETVDLLTSALVGNHEAVRRFGVVITEATLKQELLSMGIAGGTKAASEQEKMMARLNIITRSTSDAHGDAERTAGSFTNQVRALRAQVKDLAVEVGEILLPTARRLVTTLGDVVDWLSNLDDSTKRTVIIMAGAAAAVGPFLLALGSIVSIAPSVAAALAIMGGPVGWITLGITAAVAAGVALYKNWDTIAVAARVAWAAVKVAVLDAVGFVIDLYAKLYGWMPVIGDGLRSIQDGFDEIQESARLDLSKARAELESTGDTARDTAAALAETRGLLMSYDPFGTQKPGDDGTTKPPGTPGGGLQEVFDELGQDLAVFEAKVELGLIKPVNAAAEEARILEGALDQALNATSGRVTAQVEGLRDRLVEATALAKRLEQPDTLNLRLPSLNKLGLGDDIDDFYGDLLDGLKYEEVTLPATKALDAFIEQLQAKKERIAQLGRDIGGALRDGLADGATAIADSLGRIAVGTASLADLGEGLLDVFASLMQRLGGLLISFGTAGLLFQAQGGFLSFLTNPLAAIAVGGLLVAAGGAISGLLSSANGASGAGSSSGGYTVSRPYYGDGPQATSSDASRGAETGAAHLAAIERAIGGLRSDVRDLRNRPIEVDPKKARRLQYAAQEEARAVNPASR